MKKDIKSYYFAELKEYFQSIGEKDYRAQQVFKWLHLGVNAFSEMTNLSEALRKKLDDEFFISCPVVLQEQVSSIDGTTKHLWQLADGNSIESVIMEYDHGNTICI